MENEGLSHNEAMNMSMDAYKEMQSYMPTKEEVIGELTAMGYFNVPLAIQMPAEEWNALSEEEKKVQEDEIKKNLVNQAITNIRNRKAVDMVNQSINTESMPLDNGLPAASQELEQIPAVVEDQMPSISEDAGTYMPVYDDPVQKTI